MMMSKLHKCKSKANYPPISKRLKNHPEEENKENVNSRNTKNIVQNRQFGKELTNYFSSFMEKNQNENNSFSRNHSLNKKEGESKLQNYIKEKSTSQFNDTKRLSKNNISSKSSINININPKKENAALDSGRTIFLYNFNNIKPKTTRNIQSGDLSGNDEYYTFHTGYMHNTKKFSSNSGSNKNNSSKEKYSETTSNSTNNNMEISHFNPKYVSRNCYIGKKDKGNSNETQEIINNINSTRINYLTHNPTSNDIFNITQNKILSNYNTAINNNINEGNMNTARDILSRNYSKKQLNSNNINATRLTEFQRKDLAAKIVKSKSTTNTRSVKNQNNNSNFNTINVNKDSNLQKINMINYNTYVNIALKHNQRASVKEQYQSNEMINKSYNRLIDNPIKDELKTDRDKKIKIERVFTKLANLNKSKMNKKEIIYFDTTKRDNIQIPSEYLNEIYYNLLLEEKNGMDPKPEAMYMKKQKEVNEEMRSILVDWIIDVHLKFTFTDETLYMTVLIMDRYLTLVEVPRSKLQLVGIVSMMIACKHEEIDLPRVDDFIYITDNAYSREEVFKMETEVLTKLKFNLLYPSPIKFFEHLANGFEFNNTQIMMGKYLMETFLINIKYLKYRASIIACACAYIVMKYFKMANYYKAYDEKYSLIEGDSYFSNQCPESFIKDCAKEICIYIDFVNKSKYLSTVKKYSKEKYGKVAVMIMGSN